MSEHGFDFRQRPPRREARRFEPPPWEREKFERQTQDRAKREALEAAAIVDTADTTSAEAAGGPRVEAASKAELDESQVAMMMLGLRAEEPAALRGAWAVSVVAGGVVALVGLAIVIWGVVALARRGLPAAGTLAGVVLLGFGLGFLGVGAWLVFKALRQQGVL